MFVHIFYYYKSLVTLPQSRFKNPSETELNDLGAGLCTSSLIHGFLLRFKELFPLALLLDQKQLKAGRKILPVPEILDKWK